MAKGDRLCARIKPSGRHDLKIIRTLGHEVEIIWDDLACDTLRNGRFTFLRETHVTTCR